MKESIKNILKRLNLYHPLQSFYQSILFFFRNNKYKRQYKKYAGSGYTCNVCGASYQEFVPDHPSDENREALNSNQVIAGYGENVFCPNCMSTSRERLVIGFIKTNLVIDGKVILHLSPEKNIYELLWRRATVITADILPGFYKTIDKQAQKQDATQFSFQDGSFDIVIANHILEHIPEDKKAMKEILRVLKPGGMAILQVPYSEIISATLETPGINSPGLQSKMYGQKDHVRIYLFSDYIQRLKDAGFNVEVFGEEELSAFSKFAIQPGEKLLKISKPIIV